MVTAELPVSITTREAQITELVYNGLSNLQIATEIGITEKTVKFHLGRVFKKQGVVSRNQLVAKELRRLREQLND